MRKLQTMSHRDGVERQRIVSRIEQIRADMWLPFRAAVLMSAIALVVLLCVAPELGLRLFWRVTVPLLPALFLFAPGVWRNLCPLASSNQLPRLMGWSRGGEAHPLFRQAAYPLGMLMLFVAVGGRKLLFNTNAIATAALVAASLIGAFVGGLLLKGKSGWCSSICPILPVQRIYGQAPLDRKSVV